MIHSKISYGKTAAISRFFESTEHTPQPGGDSSCKYVKRREFT
jgi:hypothetical protein